MTTRGGGFVFDDVVVSRGGTRALDGLTATAAVPGVTVVVGPSGSGKSTLLRLCNRLEAPDSGTVTFEGVDLVTLDPLALRRRVGMVFQRPTPFPGTVADNLRVGVPTLGDEQVDDALERAGLDPGFAARIAGDLSGGEAQRVCLARTLVTEPDVLLLDEPTSSLDAAAAAAVEHAVLDLVTQGLAAIWVSHDREQVDRVADRVLHLERGRCVDVEIRTAPDDR